MKYKAMLILGFLLLVSSTAFAAETIRYDFDEVNVLYAAEFTAKPEGTIDPDSWIAATAGGTGLTDTITVTYGVVELKKEGQVLVTEEFLKVGGPGGSKRFLVNSASFDYYPGTTNYMQIRSFFWSAKKLVDNAVVKDFTKPIYSASIQRKFDAQGNLTSFYLSFSNEGEKAGLDFWQGQSTENLYIAASADINDTGNPEVTQAKPTEEEQPSGITQTYTSPKGFIENGLGFSISYPSSWALGNAPDEIAYTPEYVKTLLTSPLSFNLPRVVSMIVGQNETQPQGTEQGIYYTYTAATGLSMTTAGDLNVWYPDRVTLDDIEATITQPSASAGITVEMIELKRVIINDNEALYAHFKLTDTETGSANERINVYIIPGVIAGTSEAGNQADVVYGLAYNAARPPYTENFEKYKAEALEIINSFKIIMSSTG